MTATEEMVFKGAIKGKHYHGDEVDDWNLTNDVERLSTAEDENVIWATSIEELTAILEERHKFPDGLSRLLTHYRSVTVFPHAVVTDSGIASGGDHEVFQKLYATRIIEAAQKAGTICMPRYGNGPPREVYDHCVILRNDPLTLVYDPKKAQKVKERDTRRLMAKPVSADALYMMWYHLKHHLSPHMYHEGLKGGQSRLDYMNGIRISLWYFEKVFGKGVFRRMKEWQDFVKNWKTLLEPTEKMLHKEIEKYKADENKEWGERAAQRVEDFMLFMRREVKKRPPKIEDGKQIGARAQKMELPK